MDDLRITLIQPDIYWHDAEANLASLEESIWTIDTSTDLIILPEMFNTGFTMDVKNQAELINGRSFKWMKQMAAQTGAIVTGSLIIRENGHCYNRLIWMQTDGSFSFYDKRHLFRMAGEEIHFTSGKHRLIEIIKGWNICPMICYDLRFPVWMRNRLDPDRKQPEYDLAVIVANWPAARSNAWDILLKARAMENSSYVAGVNRVGADGNGVDYQGHSTVIGPKGEPAIELSDLPFVRTVLLSSEDLDFYRKKFPIYLDNDHFIVT